MYSYGQTITPTRHNLLLPPQAPGGVSILPLLNSAAQPLPSPIRPATKFKRGGRRPNVFIDDRGFPDQSDEFDTLLHNIDGGSILRKRVHPSRSLSDIDPAFNVQYDESKHGTQFRSQFKASPLLSNQQNKQLADLIKKYWCVFDDAGRFIPVKDYECNIDTGDAAPIAVKKINYGPREIPIMRKCIAALEKLGQISQVHGGRWMFKALLAPKPHQEHVTDIDDFVWRFCVNYIWDQLNRTQQPLLAAGRALLRSEGHLLAARRRRLLADRH